jgi:allantoinase
VWCGHTATWCTTATSRSRTASSRWSRRRIDVARAKKVHDGQHRLAFPGVVDAHMHSGIYSPLIEDAVSESKAAAMGGVTSSLNYFRTGQYYLNKGGPYKKFYPEVLKTSEEPLPRRLRLPPGADDGSTSTRSRADREARRVQLQDLHVLRLARPARRSNSQREFLMIGEDERYDYGAFRVRDARHPGGARTVARAGRQISLGLHCETAEVMTAYTKIVEKDKSLKGLAAYTPRARRTEGLAVFIASYLANEAALPNINLLHLSSRKAVQAAMMMADVFPHIDFKREVTIGHLMLDITSKAAELAKVNPPIRPREDVEFLWEALLAGELDWVVSDHACCRHEMKIPKHYFGNIWMAKSGFGGTEYLLPALVSEGMRRGMGFNHMARVTSWNPAQRYGLNRKGDIAAGFDADLALVDPGKDLDHRRQGLAVDAGLHPVRRAGAVGARGCHLPARHESMKTARSSASRAASTCTGPTA